MLIDAVRLCMMRDLDGLSAELEGYPDDDSVWTDLPGFANSTGTLVVHTCGSLRHFIGSGLGGSSYVRDRDREFSVRELSRAELQLLVAVTRDEVNRGLDVVDRATLGDQFPLPIGGGTMPIDRLLVHMTSHLAYHLGQADGHRRAATGERKSVGALSINAVLNPS